MAKWVEEESILALEVYLKIRDEKSESISDEHPEIVKLSHSLKRLPIHPEETRLAPSFRSLDGVRTRITNFARLERGDDKYIGKIHKNVWGKYHKNLESLRFRVQEITSQTLSFYEIKDEFTEEISFVEGQIVEKIHKSRERNRKVVRQKKEFVLAKTGNLACEVCDFDFHEVYGDIGKGFAECHHIKPLSEMISDSVETKLEDLAILCANCHRIIHRHRPWLSPLELRVHIGKEI